MFEGPFLIWGSLADPDGQTRVKGSDGTWRLEPRIVIARRRRRLGKWAAQGRWYIDNLLLPVVDADREIFGLPPVQIHPLFDKAPTTLESAYLRRPLGEVVAGISSYSDLPERIQKATQYRVRMSLDFGKQSVVCRQVVVLPAGTGGAVASIRAIPTREIIHHCFGGLVEKYQRQRPLDAIAREVAEVYLAAPARPALAVAEHFGWRTPGRLWIDDGRARQKVPRACDRAAELGYLPEAPEQRFRRVATATITDETTTRRVKP